MERDRRSEIRTAVTLRGLLGVGLACLVLSSPAGRSLGYPQWLVPALFLSNLPLLLAGRAALRWKPFDLVLVTLDTVAVTTLVVAAGGSHLAVVFFLVLLLVALGDQHSVRLVAATIVAGLDAWLVLGQAQQISPALLLRVPFFYSVALYYGFFVGRIRDEREEGDRIRVESRELRAIVDLIGDVTSSLDPKDVLRQVVRRMSEVLPARRVSVLMPDAQRGRARVLASSSDPELEPLEIDLAAYPEVREAIRKQEPLLIENAAHHETMAPVREQLRGLGVNSLLLMPLVFGDETLGTLILHAASETRGILPEHVRFCQAVAAVAANALKNANLHDELRRTLERHRTTARELSNILDHSPDLIITAESSGRILRCNAGAERVLGATRGSLVGRPLNEVYPAVGGRAAVERLTAGAAWIDHEAELGRRDGARREADLTVVPMSRAGGGTAGLLLVGRDVTELSSGRRMLQRADRLRGIGELAAGVAHELNNSLTGVMGNAQLLQMQGDLPERADELVRRIRDNSERCGRVAKNLLGFSRRRGGAQRAVSLESVLDTVIDLYAYQLRKLNIRVVRRYAEGLPRLVLDAHRVEQVFLNLIQNAVFSLREADRNGGTLEIRTRREGDRLMAEIADDGPGVPEALREKIFEPFFSTRDEEEGTGLGLSISAGIVSDHGGALECLAVDRGATFRVTFPYRPAAVQGSRDGAVRADSSPQSTDRSSPGRSSRDDEIVADADGAADGPDELPAASGGSPH